VTDPYPPIARWVIPDAARDATLWGLRRAGQHGCEGGALWLGDRASDARVLTVATAVGDGVLERPGSWSLSPAAYARIGEWAFRTERVLLGLVHSHGGKGTYATSLSPTDTFSTVQVPDFLSVVIGQHGEELDVTAWGFHVFEGRFRRLDRAEVGARILWAPGSVEHLRFDERAVEPVHA